VELFGLPWVTGTRGEVSDVEIHRLAAKFQGSESKKRDWYVNVRDLPRAYAVMICQRQNLLWDADLRLRWSAWVVAAVSIWITLGVAVALIADWSTRDLFIRWFAPNLPAILFGVRQAYGHWGVALTKQRLRLDLEGHLNKLRPGAPTPHVHARLLAEARRRQDEILNLRRRQERVPNRFYDARRREDEAAHTEAAARIRERLLNLPV
jgi:hypothetical protein